MDREEQLKIHWKREQQLVEAFEQYTGYKLELEDAGSWIAFQAFCAGYKLKQE